MAIANFIIHNLAGVGISLQGSKELLNNFKIIHQSKSSQKSHLKDLATEYKATKEFGHEVNMETDK
jgi:hypothetical protein